MADFELDILAERRIQRPVIAACQVRMQMPGDKQVREYVLALSQQSTLEDPNVRFLWWIVLERKRPRLQLGPVWHYRGPLGSDYAVYTEPARGLRARLRGGYSIEVGATADRELHRGTLMGAEAERFVGVLDASALLVSAPPPVAS